MAKKIPAAFYGPNRDGLFDPARLSPGERMYQGEAWLDEARDRRASLSPLVRRLQAATDRAFGRR